MAMQMGTNRGPFVADLFCFVTKMTILSLSHENQVGVIEAFNPTSGYLDDLLNMISIF